MKRLAAARTVWGFAAWLLPSVVGVLPQGDLKVLFSTGNPFSKIFSASCIGKMWEKVAEFLWWEFCSASPERIIVNFKIQQRRFT